MRSHRLLVRAFLALAFALLLPVTALALEPSNDQMWGAEGPLVSSLTTTSTLTGDHNDNANYDADYYFFWSSGNGTATIDFTPGGPGQYVSSWRWCAGWETRVFDPRFGMGTVGEEMSVTQGLYYVIVQGTDSADPYSLTLAGSTITTVQPPNGQRMRGRTVPIESSVSSVRTGAVTLKPAYVYSPLLGPNRIINGKSIADEDWFKFYVTSTSDVWVGSYTERRYMPELHYRGDIYNSAMTWLGATDDNVKKLHLAPGTYYIRWRYSTSSEHGYDFAVVGPYTTSAPYAKLSTPYAPTAARAGSAFRSYGTISPKDGAVPVSIQAFKLVSGKWVLKKTTSATVTDYTSSARKYSASVSLWAGSWRIRATHRCSRHLPSYSGWRYLTVK